MRIQWRLRQFFATLLLTFGLSFVFLGCVLIYANQILFDQKSFATHVVQSIQTPAVAHFLANRMSQATIQASRDLTPYRPLIYFAAREVVSSELFSPLVRTSAETLHFIVFSKGGKNLLLNISDAGTLLKSALPVLPPQLLEKIPEDLVVNLTNQVTLPGWLNQALPWMRRIGVFSTGYAKWILTLGTVLLVLAWLSSLISWQVRRSIGWILILLGILLLVVKTVGTIVISIIIENPELESAMTEIWLSFLAGATDRIIILIGIGSVLVLASESNLLKKLDRANLVQSLWKWLKGPSQSWRVQTSRSVSLMIIGYSLLKWPSLIVRNATVLLGAIAFYFGLNTLGGLIFQWAHKESQIQMLQVHRTGRVPRPVVLFLTLVFSLLGGAWIYFKYQPSALTTHFGVTCNGQRSLCNRRLDQVVFPTTHNAMASADQPRWFFPAQEAGIEAQLRDGIRGFQIDAHYGYQVENQILTEIHNEGDARRKYESVIGKEGVNSALRIRERLVGKPKGKKEIYLCHSFCELGGIELTSIFRQMAKFLVENPNEVLMIVIQDEDVLPEDIAKIADKSGILSWIYLGPVKPPWPTLRELIQKKQQVLIFAENRAGDIPWYHQAFEVFQETPYDFRSVKEFSCRPWRGKTQGDLFQMNHWITRVPAPLPSDAILVNSYEFLMKRVRKCIRERQKIPNLLAVDFYRTGDLFEVVKELNQEADSL